MMIENCQVDHFISNLIQAHKFDVSHRHAFSLHKSMVVQLKKCKFTLPPKRVISSSWDSKSECEDSQSSQETATSEDNSNPVLDNNEILRTAAETQGTTLNKIISILTQYEEYLMLHNLVQGDELKRIVQFNRSLLAHVLEKKQEFSSIPRDSVALTIILLNAEKSHLNKTLLLKFITETLQNKRISKISQLRRGKSYLLLSPVVYGSFGGQSL